MKPTDSDDTIPDGGRALEGTDLFTRTADVQERSTGEKLYILYDGYVGAPFRVAWSDVRMRIGVAVVLGFILVGTIGPRLIEQPAVAQGPQFARPFQSLDHPIGTDNLGRDLFAMVVYATPAMLKMVVAGGFVSAGLGTIIGTTSGYVGGWVDRVLMIVSDTVLTIPAFPFIIVVAAVWNPQDPFLIGVMLGIDNWPGLARSLRSQVLSIREEDATEAARAMGISKLTILRRYVIAALAPYILVKLARSSRNIITESVALYYLGILSYTSLNWGVMLDEAYSSGFMTDPNKVHWIIAPMIPIILVSMGFVLLAQGMDRVFNVRLRARHAKTQEDDDAPPVELG